MDAASQSKADNLVVQWFGDIGLNGLYCDPQNHSAITANMAGVAAALGPADLRIANWESPLWGDGRVNEAKSPRVSTTRQTAEAIHSLGLNVALLASNHIYDCREAGLENTIRFLDENHIRWLGAGRSPEEAARPLTLTCRERRIGLLNYLGPETNPCLPPDAGVYVNFLDGERLLSEVRALRGEADIIFVALHRGQEEFVDYPTVEERRLARRAVQAGAAVVACHHAHCLQGHESWDRGHIFYGLGNFLFDASFHGRPSVWPARCRRIGVGRTTIDCSGAVHADMRFFRQEYLLLMPDDTPARRRRQERLNAGLQLSDRGLAARYRRGLFAHRYLLPPVRFVQASGGILPAIGRLARKCLNALSG